MFINVICLLFRRSNSNNQNSQESMSELNEDSPDLPTSVTAIKTFHAKTVQSLSDCDIPKNSEFRPIQTMSEHEEYQSSPEIEKLVSKLTISESNLNATNVSTKTNGAKKKRKRKKKLLSTEGKVEEPGEEESRKTADDIRSLNEETCCGSSDALRKNDILDEEVAKLEEESNVQGVNSITSDLHFFSDTDIPCG